MCGFTAHIALHGNHADRQLLERMTATIAHRGPDDFGYHVQQSVGLGFRRLSILDLSPAGHQPMSLPGTDLTIVFNGEIYNFIELRDELKCLGHTFRSRGDTEVLLHAYAEWGADCVTRLNGMWAFLIYDHSNRRLFGCRDRFGIKPLFMWRNANHVLFASEVKAIRASGLYQPKADLSVSAEYLLQNLLDRGRRTLFEGVEQIPAATAFELSLDGHYKEWRYWRVEEIEPARIDAPARVFGELFEDAVRIHMRSDVPVGVHLSGGLDSTSIICSSARIREANNASGALMAFSYIAPEYDESAYIRDTIDYSRATLVRLETSAIALWESLEKVIAIQDAPIYGITALVGYELMGLAASHGIKVVLNGQGADETIGGYPTYFADYWLTLIEQGRLATAWQEMRAYNGVHGGSTMRTLLRQAKRLLQSKLGAIGPYRALANWRRRVRVEENPWFTSELTSVLLPPEVPWSRGLGESLTNSVLHSPLPLYLRVEDRNSMAHSIEARVPFLDSRIVDLLFSLPAEWHLRGPWNKYVLREGMKNKIPEKVRTRVDKMGFPTPARSWFAGPLYEPIRDLLSSRATRERGLYRTDSITADLERHRRGEIDCSAALFKVAQFEAWFRSWEGKHTETTAWSNHPPKRSASLSISAR